MTLLNFPRAAKQCPTVVETCELFFSSDGKMASGITHGHVRTYSLLSFSTSMGV